MSDTAMDIDQNLDESNKIEERLDEKMELDSEEDPSVKPIHPDPLADSSNIKEREEDAKCETGSSDKIKLEENSGTDVKNADSGGQSGNTEDTEESTDFQDEAHLGDNKEKSASDVKKSDSGSTEDAKGPTELLVDSGSGDKDDLLENSLSDVKNSDSGSTEDAKDPTELKVDSGDKKDLEENNKILSGDKGDVKRSSDLREKANSDVPSTNGKSVLTNGKAEENGIEHDTVEKSSPRISSRKAAQAARVAVQGISLLEDQDIDQLSMQLETSQRSKTLNLSRPENPSKTVNRLNTENPSKTVNRLNMENTSKTMHRLSFENPSKTVNRLITENPSKTVNRLNTENPSKTINRLNTENPSKTANRLSQEKPSKTVNRSRTNISDNSDQLFDDEDSKETEDVLNESSDSIQEIDSDDPLADPLADPTPDSLENGSSLNKSDDGIVFVDTESILARKSQSTNGKPIITPPKVINLGGGGVVGSSLLKDEAKIMQSLPPGITITKRPVPVSNPVQSAPVLHRALNSGLISNPMITISPVVPQAPVLAPPKPADPNVTKDTVVFEAASLVSPYIYERPPKEKVKDFISSVEKLASELKRDSDNNDDDVTEITKPKPATKANSYFETTLGKFVVDLGLNFVQEYVQSDVLKSMSRKNSKNKTDELTQSIADIKRNLEFQQKKNKDFKFPAKKCRRCNFLSESQLVIDHHEEAPHFKNGFYMCSYCKYDGTDPLLMQNHMRDVHGANVRMEPPLANHQCSLCPYEANERKKVKRHALSCEKRFVAGSNQAPVDWQPPAKVARSNQSNLRAIVPPMPSIRPPIANTSSQNIRHLPGLNKMGFDSTAFQRIMGTSTQAFRGARPSSQQMRVNNPLLMNSTQVAASAILSTLAHNQSLLLQTLSQSSQKFNPLGLSPSLLPGMRFPSGMRQPFPTFNATSPTSSTNAGLKVCEICDGFSKDIKQLRNHLKNAHGVKIHPKMVHKPPLNCQKCTVKFFSDEGLERHMLGTHSLVTPMMKDKVIRGKDSGRCPHCGKNFISKMVQHMTMAHGRFLKEAHLAYKCTLCSSTFTWYKLFEKHVYDRHGPGSHDSDAETFESYAETKPKSSSSNLMSGENSSNNSDVVTLDDDEDVEMEENDETKEKAKSDPIDTSQDDEDTRGDITIDEGAGSDDDEDDEEDF